MSARKMANEIIIVPEYNYKKLLILLEYEEFIDEIRRREGKLQIPYPEYAGEYNRKETYNYVKFFSKFGNPEAYLSIEKIKKKYPNLKLEKFISFEKDIFYPLYIPYNHNSLQLNLKIAIIREPIVSYIEQTIKVKDDDLECLKEVFSLMSNNTADTFDEYIKQKIKYLTSLDMDKYAQELRKRNNDLINKRLDIYKK